MKSNLTKTGALMLLLVSTMYCVDSRAAECPQAHCSQQISKDFSKICDEDNLKTQKVYVPYNGSLCYCACSCFVGNTSISTATGSAVVNDIATGDVLETPAGGTAVKRAMRSSVENHPVLKITLDNGASVTVSNNHALITADGIVKAAADVVIGNQLLDESGSALTVIDVQRVNYSGILYNYILAGHDDSGKDRIVLAGGVQSGDWLVQTHRDYVKANVALRLLISNIKENNR